MATSNSITSQNSSRIPSSPLPRPTCIPISHGLICRLYTVVFVRSSGTWLVPLTKRLVQQGIALAHDTFVQLQRNRTYDSTYPFETPAKLLQRLLNSIMSDRLGTKTSIAYFIGNQLFRCYFKATPPLYTCF